MIGIIVFNFDLTLITLLYRMVGRCTKIWAYCHYCASDPILYVYEYNIIAISINDVFIENIVLIDVRRLLRQWWEKNDNPVSKEVHLVDSNITTKEPYYGISLKTKANHTIHSNISKDIVSVDSNVVTKNITKPYTKLEKDTKAGISKA